MKRHHKAILGGMGIAGALVWGLAGRHPAPAPARLPTPLIAPVYSDQTNAQLGIGGKQGRLLGKDFFVINYNDAWGSAYWVAECLTPADLKGNANRKGVPFYAEPDLPDSLAVTPKDYVGSGYDRGHLAPAGDMVRSKEAMRTCFTMANMHAQTGDLNRKAWRILEGAVRESVKVKARTWVVTGQLVDPSYPKWIGKTHQVVVPDQSFKVVLLLDPAGNYSGFGALGLNDKTDASVTYVSVDSVEALSAFDFFPLLPDSIEDKIERAP